LANQDTIYIVIDKLINVTIVYRWPKSSFHFVFNINITYIFL